MLKSARLKITHPINSTNHNLIIGFENPNKKCNFAEFFEKTPWI